MSRAGRRQIHALAATLAVLALAASACSQRAVAPDQNLSTGVGFRGGPDRAGVIEGSGPAHPKVQWSIDTGGHVISSPIPLEDGIVVVGGDGSLRRIDLDGTQQWSRQIGASEATPVIVGDVVLEPDSSGSLFAVSVNDGEVIWKKALGGSVRSSPLVANGRLIDGVDDELVTVDISDGSVVDRFPLGASTGSSPALADGVAVIGDADNQVIALDSTHGSKIWFHDFGHPSMPDTFFKVAEGVVATPAILDGVAYVGSVNGRMGALDISDGTVVWEVSLDGPIYSSAAVADAVFVTTAAGTAYALDPETGTEIWETPLGDASYASPLLATDLVVVTSEAGIVFGLDPVDGAVMWQVSIGNKGDYMASTPTLVSGLVVAGSNTGRVVGLGDAEGVTSTDSG